MNRVPADIRRAITNSAKWHSKSYEYDKIIEEWLDELGLGGNDTVRDNLIDCVQVMGTDPNGFIEFMEEFLSGNQF